jgi:hypothetical protein
LHGVSAVRFDAVTGLLRNQSRRHDPALRACFAQGAIEPVATGAGFIDEDAILSFGLAFSDEAIDVGLSRSDGPEVGDLSTVVLRDIRDRDGFFMDIEPDVQRARLAHG